MASFLVLWAASLVWRAVLLGLGRRRCPSCGRNTSAPATACAGCGFASEHERDFRGVRIRWGLIALAIVATTGAAVAVYAAEQVRAWTQGQERERAIIGAWASAALGVAVFGAVTTLWSWRGDRSRGRKRCPRCWYDMSGGGLMCPECGHDAGVLRHLYRPRRRRKTAVLGLVIILASYGVWVAPRVRSGSWVAAIPTTVMILGWSWLPDSVVTRGAARSEDWSLLARTSRWSVAGSQAWGWQRRWIQARAKAALGRTTDPIIAARACQFMNRGLELEECKRLLSLLVSGLRDPRTDRREAAASLWPNFQLWAMQYPDEHRAIVVPRLNEVIGAVADPSDAVSTCAMGVIGLLGPDAEPAVGALAAVARDGAVTPLRRNTAIAAWSTLLHDCPSARAIGAEWLRSSDPLNRRAAILAYASYPGWYPRGSDPYVPPGLAPGETAVLHSILGDGPDYESQMAALALVRHRTDDATIAALLDQASSARANRDTYLRFVPECGRAAGAHLDRIAAFLADASVPVRLTCIEVLSRMSFQYRVDVRPAIPLLRDRLTDEDPGVVEAARGLLDGLQAGTNR